MDYLKTEKYIKSFQNSWALEMDLWYEDWRLIEIAKRLSIKLRKNRDKYRGVSQKVR